MAKFNTGNIVLLQQGNIYIYGRVNETNEQGEPLVETRDGDKLQVAPALVYPVTINRLSLQDFGFVYMPRTASLSNQLFAKGFAMKGNTRLKLFQQSDGTYTIQVDDDLYSGINYLAELQQIALKHLGFEFNLSKIGNEMPTALSEIKLIDEYSTQILSDNQQARMAGYQGLVDLLPQSQYNSDVCEYWIAEYHYENYLNTKSEQSKMEALKFYESTYAHGGYDFLLPKIGMLKK